MLGFRTNSTITKEFQQRCIDEKIIINLYRPNIRDYFKSIKFSRTISTLIKVEDAFYLKISSEDFEKDDTPEYFTEIKASEFYKIKEEAET